MKPIANRIVPTAVLRAGLLVILWLAPGAGARAAATPFLEKPRASYEAKLEAIRKTYQEEALAGISNKYCKLLADYAASSRAQGKLNDYLAAQKELERFQAEGQLGEPNVVTDNEYVAKTQRSAMGACESNRGKMQQEESTLRQSYIQFLERSKITLTQQNQIDQAILVDAEIEQIEAAQASELPAPAAPIGASPVPTMPSAQIPIPENRLVVVATGADGPVAGLSVTLKSHTFNKVFNEKTDRMGRAEFRILPELEYLIYVLDPRFDPFIQPHCVGGESYPVELQTLPEGVQFIVLPATGDISLPGISNLRISGYGANPSGITSVTMNPSSIRTTVSGNPPGQDTVKMPLDTWTTISERSRNVESKMLAPTPETRIVLYRALPPDNASTAGADGGTGPAVQNPAGSPSSLSVLAKNPTGPAAGLEVVLYSGVDGKAMAKKTDRNGKAEFAINPDVEYTLQIADKHYEPFVKPNCIGGETYVAELAALPKGVDMLTMGRAGDLNLPGISPLQIFGHTGTSGSVAGIYLRPTSPKTTFSGQPPGQDRILVNVNQWTTVTERTKNVEFKILAPSADVRIVLYRKVP